ncbi:MULTISPECIES: hypothetical protein [Streptomyces]|uniref:hypothetical protein n=1 Tax=Streptomyces TaxID=1883 RepID=UPI00226E4DD3|nr:MULTISPECIES: hypothetical protein [unclassified Streptomyces]MCY0921676.1 hypothetical protein [Streptomyces sp. H27-G5]MCY0944009.1 hypothetical protein [Streptomyces sp. H34-AA3]MCY0956271.1 hypothetical protein [Streptomyces sp. H27-H5]MCZ4082291.1 hypothetical protein [Streptomyces sp. H34-S5]
MSRGASLLGLPSEGASGAHPSKSPSPLPAAGGYLRQLLFAAASDLTQEAHVLDYV